MQGWREKWRKVVRLSETALVVGLWAGGVAATDIVVAQLLLISGLIIAAITVAASNARHVMLIKLGLIFTLLLMLEVTFFWRYNKSSQANDVVQSPFVSSQTKGLGNGAADTSYIVDVDCQRPSPLEIAPKVYNVISAFMSRMDSFGVGQMSQPARSVRRSMNKNYLGLRCTVANYGPLPVYKLVIPHKTKFMGKEVNDPILIGTLKPSPERTFEFYVQQADGVSGELTFSGLPEAVDINGVKIRKISMSVGSAGPFRILAHADKLIDP